jgi:RNA polymerase sigma-70 factor (ECF subfamily)
MEDTALVERARQGSRDAFEDLVKRYERKVFHLAYGFVQDRAAADDLAQEVFIKAYFALPKFQAKSEFGTWLYRIAVNHVKDHLRKAARKKEVSLEEIGDLPFVGVDEVREREDMRAQDERKKVIFRVLQGLPEKYRTILTLRDVQGLSYEEVAGMLAISRGTVDSRLHRARKMLRKKMGPYLTPQGGANEA